MRRILKNSDEIKENRLLEKEIGVLSKSHKGFRINMCGNVPALGSAIAALDEIKEFIRSRVPIAALEKRAFMLAGLSSKRLNDGFAVFCRELADSAAKAGMPENIRVGFVIAAADIVRERLAEIESRGTGRA